MGGRRSQAWNAEKLCRSLFHEEYDPPALFHLITAAFCILVSEGYDSLMT